MAGSGENLAQARDDDRNLVFRNARAHSGRVRFAKIFLPVIALVTLVGTAGYLWYSQSGLSVAIDLAATAIQDGKLVMANPKLDGFTKDNRPYSLRATSAVQDLSGSGAIELENIQATLPMDDGDTARVAADTGVFDSDKNTLDMYGTFTVQTTAGMLAELQSAAIDLAAGNLVTPDPVRITYPGVTLVADRFEIEDNGKRLFFESRVKLVIKPEAMERSQSESVPETSPEE